MSTGASQLRIESPNHGGFLRLGALHYIVLALGLAAGVPVLVLGLFAADAAETRERARFDIEAAMHAQSVATTLDSYLDNKAEMLGVTAESMYTNPNRDLVFLQSLVDSQMLASSAFMAVYVADEDGTALVFGQRDEESLGQSGVGMNYADRGYAKELLRTNQPAFTEVLMGRTTQVPTMVIALPVHEPQSERGTRDIRGWVGAGMAMDELASLVLRTSQPSTRTMVLDENHRVLVDSSQRLSTLTEVTSGVHRTSACGLDATDGLDEQGVPIRTACTQIKIGQQSWRVWTSTEQARLTDAAMQARRSTAGVVGITVFALALVTALLSVLMRSWLQNVVSMAHRVGAGDFSFRPRVVSPYAPREMRLVAEATSHTLQQLEEAARRNTRLVGELQQANAQLEPLAGAWMHVGEAIEVLDAEGRIQFVNPAYCTMFEVRADDVDGLLSRIFESEDDIISSVVSEVENPRTCLKQGRPWTAEIRSRVSDREVIQSVTASPILDATGATSMIIVIRRDMTAERRAQSEDAHRARLASIGTLAAGFAHEINNPLTYVLGNLEVLHDHLKAQGNNESLSEPIGLIEETSEGVGRIAQIVRGLLSMVRREDATSSTGTSRLLDLVDVAHTAVEVAESKLDERIEVDLALPSRLVVVGVESELVQVVLNLLLNAAEAMPGGDLHAARIRVSGGRTDSDVEDHVFVEVEDNGVGMDSELIERVFDPFFTTKGPTDGTGLGLSVAQGIIELHGGRLTVQSEVGQGTTFRISLPAAVSRVRRPSLPSTRKVEPERLPRVLVVDDDHHVATGMARVLRRRYAVTVTNSGAEALALLGGNEEFDGIISDMMMPEMNGLEFFERLKGDYPLLAKRLLFVTGCEPGGDEVRQLQATGRPVLSKPFSPGEFREQVYALVSDGSAA